MLTAFINIFMRRRNQSIADIINKKSICIVIIIVAVLACCLLIIDKISEPKVDISAQHSTPKDAELAMRTIHLPSGDFVRKDSVTTYLIIGLDDVGKIQSSNAYVNSNQADYLVLVAVDNESRVCDFVAINRDTMAYVPMLGVGGQKTGTKAMQIALAYNYGDGTRSSCENTADAVSALFYGIPVDYYVAMSMDAVAALTDYVGGVDIKLDEDYTEIDPSYVNGADIILKGSAALDFVRARRQLTDATNINRMHRQSLFMKAFMDKLSTITISDSFLDGANKAVSDYVLADANLNNLYEFVSNIHDYSFEDIKSPEGTSVDGAKYTEFYVDPGNLEKMIADVWCE